MRIPGTLALLALASCDAPDLSPRRIAAGGHEASSELAELHLEGLPPEHGRSSLRPSAALDDVLARLRAIADERHTRGVFLRVSPLIGGAARADELAAALQRIRSAGKPVHCHVELADNLAYSLVARSCDRLTMTPAGHLAVVGVAAHLTSVRGLLSLLGVQMDMVQAGDAKGAADPFTRDEPTPAHRANVDQLVRERQARLVSRIASRTRRAPAQVEALLAEAPFTSTQALQYGLVDDVEFDDEAREHARVAAHADRVVDRTPGSEPGPRSLADLVALLTSPDGASEPEGKHLVVARLCGTIVDGPRSTEDTVASEPFVAAMRRFALDDDVAAVVLRIDSPGGSALASDRMWHAVHRLSEHKPVVVSVGDMAASGGYYVAAGAREIFANDGSIVGSIGVVAGRPNLSVLLDRVGVRVTTLATAPSADLFSPFRALREDERARFEASAAEAYGRFLSRIAVRRPSVKQPDAVEGRVFTGATAVTLGLVDRLGGLDEAAARARTLGHLSADAPVHHWPAQLGLLDAMFGSELGAHAATTLDPELAALLRSLETDATAPTAPQAALPYQLRIH